MKLICTLWSLIVLLATGERMCICQCSGLQSGCDTTT